MLIILSPEQATFYDFVKPRQEATGQTLVILDRRRSERRADGQGAMADRRRSERRTESKAVAPDRRRGERRKDDTRRRSRRREPTPEAALALMSVLGFMVLHREGDRWVP